ncbi:MAG TPA: hypothetical protein PLR18_03145 [bacterium]|nr:hypothetical protein [bacterium]
MFKQILIILIIIFSIVIQISLLPSLGWFVPLVINLPLLIAASFALWVDFALAIFIACLAGLFLDYYSPFFFGFFSLVFLLSTLLIKFFCLNFLQHRNLGSFLVANFFALLVLRVTGLLAYFFLAPENPSLSHWFFFLGQLAVHGLLAMIIYFLINPLVSQRKNLAFS